MSDKDREIMNNMVEERIKLKKERDTLNNKLFELDRRIWLMIDVRVKVEIDKEK